MQAFTIYGKLQNKLLPILAKSKLGDDNTILDVMFETNPLDKVTCLYFIFIYYF